MAIINRHMLMHGPAFITSDIGLLPVPSLAGADVQTVPQYQNKLQPRFFGELIESLTGIPDEVVDIAAVGAAGLGLVAAVAAPFVLPAVIPALGAGAAVAGGIAAAEGAALAGEAAVAGGVAAAEGAALAGEAAMAGGAAAAEGAAFAGEAAAAGGAAAAEGMLTAEEAAATVGMTVPGAESTFEGELAWDSMSSLDLGPPAMNIPRDTDSNKSQYVAMVCPNPETESPACHVAGEWMFAMKEDGSGPEIEAKEQLEIMRSMLMLLTKPDLSEFPTVSFEDARPATKQKDKKIAEDNKNDKNSQVSDASQLAFWVDLDQLIQDLQTRSWPSETTTSKVDDTLVFDSEGYEVYHNIDPNEVDDLMLDVFMSHLFPVTEHPVKADDDDNDDFDVVRELLDFGFSMHKDWLDLFVSETPTETLVDKRSADKTPASEKPSGKYVQVTM